MYCEKCGNKINISDKFCTKCGHSVMQVEKSEQAPEVFTVQLNERWWHRLLKVLYIVAYLPLLLIIPLVWSSNTLSCYYSYCSGSYTEAFWYSILALVIYVLILRLVKLAVNYVVGGRKPEWKKEFKKLF